MTRLSLTGIFPLMCMGKRTRTLASISDAVPFRICIAIFLTIRLSSIPPSGSAYRTSASSFCTALGAPGLERTVILPD